MHAIQMETTDVISATRYYVMAVTPTRLYSFTGIGSLEVGSYVLFGCMIHMFIWLHDSYIYLAALFACFT